MLEKQLKINNNTLNYKEFSSENNHNNIIILHGWGGSSDSWLEASELFFEKGFNVFVPDLPGFGKTPLNKVFNLDDYAEFIEKFLQDLKLENYIIMGHSNGGAITIKLESRQNTKAERIILNNSAGIRNDKKRSLKRKILNKVATKLKSLKKIPGFGKLRNLFYRAIGSHDYLKAEKNPFLLETYKNMISSDLSNEIKNIKLNTLLIRGELDSYTPVSDAYFMRENIKNSKLTILEAEKHGIHLHNPEKLVNTILNNI